MVVIRDVVVLASKRMGMFMRRTKILMTSSAITLLHRHPERDTVTHVVVYWVSDLLGDHSR